MRVAVFPFILLLLLCLGAPQYAMSMGDNDGYYSAPKPKNPGKYVKWECSFVADHAPPLPQEADTLFREARALEKQATLTSGEEEEVLDLYRKAASMGHWKAMNNLIACYLYGRGTEINYDAAIALADELVKMNVGYGLYAQYIIHKKGMGVPADSDKADELLHKAADFGVPEAQYELGMFYLYPERRDKQGLQYLVCAARQGHGEAMYKIGTYLDNKNYYMSVEYLYRATSLGHVMAPLALKSIFHPLNAPDSYENNYGFPANEALSNTFRGYY